MVQIFSLWLPLLVMLLLPVWIWQTIKNYRLAFGDNNVVQEEQSKAKILFIIMIFSSVLSLLLWALMIDMYFFSGIQC